MEMEADPDSSSPSAGADGAATASGETKACAACHTTKTPLWRGGPEGPKSLCNACGIRYRKRRQALGHAAADTQQDQQRQPKRKAADPPAEDQQQLLPKKKAADPPAEDQQPPKKKAASAASSTTTSTKKEKEKERDRDRKRKDRQVTVELRVVGFGKEAVLKQRRQMRRDKCLSRLSEEETAAVHLMALSSGVIYAS